MKNWHVLINGKIEDMLCSLDELVAIAMMEMKDIYVSKDDGEAYWIYGDGKVQSL